jgi:hypothetical protein
MATTAITVVANLDRAGMGDIAKLPKPEFLQDRQSVVLNSYFAGLFKNYAK